MKTIYVLASSLLLTSSAWASSNTPHTMHNINVTDEGNWQGRLVITSADEPAYFTDQSGANKGEMYDFTLNKETSPFVYGFGFDTGADFNVSYTLTLYESTNKTAALLGKSQFTSKSCQFNVSATGPAKPDIKVEKYNGSSCTFNIDSGVGENFLVG